MTQLQDILAPVHALSRLFCFWTRRAAKLKKTFLLTVLVRLFLAKLDV